MEISIKDIIIEACGKENNKTKSSVSLFNELWCEDGSQKTLEEIDLDKPVINISKHGNFVTVDLAFNTHLDADFRQCVHLLEKFYRAENSEDDNDTEIPMLVLSIVPHKYEGLYYMLGFNPLMWTILPSSPSEVHPDTIRLVYTEEDFSFYKAEEPVDIETIKSEAQSEVEKEYSEN